MDVIGEKAMTWTIYVDPHGTCEIMALIFQSQPPNRQRLLLKFE